MYRDSVDAFRQLLSPAVSRISSTEGRLQNGIGYCMVQVSLASGEEYLIEAYDGEAEELCCAAREQSELLCTH